MQPDGAWRVRMFLLRSTQRRAASSGNLFGSPTRPGTSSSSTATMAPPRAGMPTLRRSERAQRPSEKARDLALHVVVHKIVVADSRQISQRPAIHAIIRPRHFSRVHLLDRFCRRGAAKGPRSRAPPLTASNSKNLLVQQAQRWMSNSRTITQ